MTPSAVLSQLAALGVTVEVEGPHLRLRPASAVPPDLLAEMREKKGALLWLLANWPEACLDCERRFGRPEARLYPLVDRRVRGPRGEGVLLHVLAADCCRVLYDGASVSSTVSCWELLPAAED